MSVTEAREDIFLQSLLPRYEAEGFTVVIQPSPSFLPPFMGKYRPDAIALSPSRKIAIEIKRDASAPKRMRGIPELFAQHPDWELRVYCLASLSGELRLKAPTPRSIELAIKEVSELKDSRHNSAAIMMAWSVLEAIGRALLPEKLARPQPVARLVEVLASEGLITPNAADSLRRAEKLRNAVAHGDLDTAARAEDVDSLVASLRRLAVLLPERELAGE
jgi:uncharacterized protein YutE (UPF0331/DUF86 family)